MAHVITGACCSDATCVAVCPVNCIHPTPDEPGFATAEMLYVDPDACIDCSACVPVCPVGAIDSEFVLPPTKQAFVELNAVYYEDPAHQGYPEHRAHEATVPRHRTDLRVAVVGTGPAACYAVEELRAAVDGDLHVTVLDQELTPGGLVRFGVAPDHLSTKDVARSFARSLSADGIDVRLGVQVGRDVTVEHLLATHHAVIVAAGASVPRALPVPGAALPGVLGAIELAAWYNGRPGHAVDLPETATEVVVVGNGNVALDVARILTADDDHRAASAMAAEAAAAIGALGVRTVTVVGRRGAEHAAFTTPELLDLEHLPVDVVADAAALDRAAEATAGDPLASYKIAELRRLTSRPRRHERAIVFAFGLTPAEVEGDDRATAVRCTDAGGATVLLPADLVVASIGSRGAGVPGVPLEESTGVVPHVRGRVVGPDGAPARGLYVAGWLKRGPSGVIGTNRACSAETVTTLLGDLVAGGLDQPTEPLDTLEDVWASAGATTPADLARMT